LCWSKGTVIQGSARMGAACMPVAILCRRRMKDRRAIIQRRRLRMARSRVLKRTIRNANNLSSIAGTRERWALNADTVTSAASSSPATHQRMRTKVVPLNLLQTQDIGIRAGLPSPSVSSSAFVNEDGRRLTLAAFGHDPQTAGGKAPARVGGTHSLAIRNPWTQSHLGAVGSLLQALASC
jgi:hypothetical protein